MLKEINKKWSFYKDRYHLDSPIQIEEVRFDAEKGVDSSFDIKELYSGQWILHLSNDIHSYRSDYVDYILWHEFTHLYDFLTQPYEYKVMRKIYLYMNTYSEYHASRRALGWALEKFYPKGLDPDKCVLPSAHREISLRKLVSDTLHQAELSRAWFIENPSHQAFHVYLRYLMYLMGYASHFENKEDILGFCLDDLKEEKDIYQKLFKIMEEKDFFKILPHMDEIYKSAGISDGEPVGSIS